MMGLFSRLDRYRALASGLTGAQTPEDLFYDWFKQAHYSPSDVVQPAAQFAQSRQGGAWEAAELTYQEIRRMGVPAYMLFLAGSADPKDTHTTVLYKGPDGWRWFEWAWKKQRGLHGPFPSFDDARKAVYQAWRQKKGLTFAKVWNSPIIVTEMTAAQYITRASVGKLK